MTVDDMAYHMQLFCNKVHRQDHMQVSTADNTTRLAGMFTKDGMPYNMLESVRSLLAYNMLY